MTLMADKSKLTPYDRLRRMAYRVGEPRKTFTPVPTSVKKPKSVIIMKKEVGQ